MLQQIYARCPDADIITIDRTPHGYVEIDHLCNGRMVEVGFMNGVEEFREEEIALDEAPMERIGQKIAKDHPAGFLDEVSLMTVKDTSFIKAEVIENGIEYHLFFTREGKVYRPARDMAAEKWPLNAIGSAGITGPAGHDLLRPDTIIELPPILREISGITVLNANTVLCVQDELGVVFHLDLPGGHIKKVQRFTDVGDFEDITAMNGAIKVLRSDGMIFTLEKDGSISQQLLQLPTLNVEGLHYSAKDERLLLVSKEPPLAGGNSNGIYSIADGKATELFPIDEQRIIAHLQRTAPTLVKGKIAFAPSALAVHPMTGELYVLSAADRLIAIYDDKGLHNVVPLPAETYFKPEGIAFLPNGDMLISTEGDKKGFALPAIILTKYRK